MWAVWIKRSHLGSVFVMNKSKLIWARRWGWHPLWHWRRQWSWQDKGCCHSHGRPWRLLAWTSLSLSRLITALCFISVQHLYSEWWRSARWRDETCNESHKCDYCKRYLLSINYSEISNTLFDSKLIRSGGMYGKVHSYSWGIFVWIRFQQRIAKQMIGIKIFNVTADFFLKSKKGLIEYL